MLLELIPENAGEGKQLRADVLERLNMVSPKSLQEHCTPQQAACRAQRCRTSAACFHIRAATSSLCVWR